MSGYTQSRTEVKSLHSALSGLAKAMGRTDYEDAGNFQTTSAQTNGNSALVLSPQERHPLPSRLVCDAPSTSVRASPSLHDSSEDVSKLPRYLRRVGHHINILIKRAEARVRKKSREKMERTRQWASRNIIPCHLAGKFPEGERAVISYFLNVAKRTGFFHGYLCVIAEKVGVCTKTVTRALQRAASLGMISIEHGKFDGRKNGKSTIRLTSSVVYEWIKRCATAGLSSLTKGIKETFFVRPATVEVVKSSAENA